MKKIKLKKKRKIDKISLLSIVIILIILSIYFALIYINNKISPVLINYAEMEAEKLSNLIINRAITKQITNNIDINKLFTTIQNKSGEIQTIDFNPTIVNKVLSMTTNLVQLNLKAIEQGNINLIELPDEILVEYDKEKLKKGIIYEIPLGYVTGNAFLSNLGPRVPVKLSLIGSVISNINTKIKQYGINNALIEVYVHIEVTQQVNIPFMSKRSLVKTDIPVALKVIQGKVPEYYQGGGMEKNSSIFALPIE